MTGPEQATRRSPRWPTPPSTRNRRSRPSRPRSSPSGRATRPSRRRSTRARPARRRANEYVFYDGPPFANGLPHYGHLLTGFVKDAVPRYQTMRGRRVERRFGWDCHGLPAEVEAEKELGLSGRPEIVEYGIDRFNEPAGRSVLRYTNEWERYVTRQARWVDFDNDYKTLDLPYMESVMWAFKLAVGQGARSTRGSASSRTAGAARRRSATPRPAWTTSTGTARTRRSPSWFELEPTDDGPRAHPRLDDHAVDAAVQPGARRRSGHRLRGRWRRTGSATSSPRPGSAHYERELAGADAGRHA